MRKTVLLCLLSLLVGCSEPRQPEKQVDETQFFLEGNFAEVHDTGDSYWIDLPVGISGEDVTTRRFTWDKSGRLVAIGAEELRGK